VGESKEGITMISLNTNIVASNAARNLSINNTSLQKSLQRLSSGSRIANPADDAGGLAVSMRLSAQIKRSRGVEANINNAISLNQVQDGALATTASILDRMSELRSFADDVTKNTSDIANYNTEFQQLRNQLKNIVGEKFNGISLFAGGSNATFGTTAASTLQLKVYTTEAGAAGSVISLSKLSLESALNVRGAGSNKVNTNFSAGANLAATQTNTVSLSSFSIAEITKAIENVATLRANNAALNSRLQFAVSQLKTSTTNVESANSRIFDVDVATESANFARSQIKVQSSASMIAQANGLSGIALSLLG
jgi:flagellin